MGKVKLLSIGLIQFIKKIFKGNIYEKLHDFDVPVKWLEIAREQLKLMVV